MILEFISEIQEPLEASQAIHEDVDGTPTKRSLFVRGPSSFNLRSSSANLRALSTPESPPLRRASTAGGIVQSPNRGGMKDEWLASGTSDKLVELKNLRAHFVKKNYLGTVHRIDMVPDLNCRLDAN